MAIDIGPLPPNPTLPPNGNPIIYRDSVDDTETEDLYRFRLGSRSNLNVALTDLDADSDADVELYRDRNGNGRIDYGTDDFIGDSLRLAGEDESINHKSLAAGNYIARVYQFSGDTEYKLALSTGNPSNLLPTEVEVGNLSSQGSFFDSGTIERENTADVYHFSLDTAGDFSLDLTNLSSDADVRLIQDTNNNDVVRPNEVIAASTGTGTSESINEFLNPGDYFVQVYQYSGNTGYDLALFA